MKSKQAHQPAITDGESTSKNQTPQYSWRGGSNIPGGVQSVTAPADCAPNTDMHQVPAHLQANIYVRAGALTPLTCRTTARTSSLLWASRCEWERAPAVAPC